MRLIGQFWPLKKVDCSVRSSRGYPPRLFLPQTKKGMSSGVAIADRVIEVFQDFKLKKAYRFVIFKLADDFSSIGVDKTSEPTGTYDNFIASLPKDGCRYAVYDFEYSTNDGPRNKLLFFTWSPDTAKIKQKMVYASSKDGLKKKLDGVYTEIQATDLAEVSYETVFDKA